MLLELQKKANLVFVLSSLLFFAIAIVLTQIASSYLVARETEKVEAVVARNLVLIRSKIEGTIFQDAYLADSLATVVTIDPALAIIHWESIAAKLMSKASFVRNIGIAPNDVISMIYPIEGNEAALELDFRTRPEQYKSILKAKELKQVYIAGPLTLVQGGLGLIARYPIFSDYPLNEHYWGGVSVVMDYDAMIEDSGLVDFGGATIALRTQSSDGVGEVFYGSAAIFDNPDIEHTIRLPSDSWLLAAKFTVGELQHIREIRTATMSISAFVTLLVYLMLFLHFRNYKQLHKASLFDELTQLPNRRFIINLLNELTSKGLSKPSFALLNIDLNDFKQVNDDIGHEAGDELLKHVSMLLSDNIRASDSVARFGGDEFIVILRDVPDDEGAALKVSQMKRAVESQPLIWDERVINPSLSIGYTVYRGQVTNVKQLLSEADKSMYLQKKVYREQVA
ncbi:sensor domain-containing diguanylate cyclase [Alginatibacterium sediminis]|uniref:Sensor domain-containing diguanylate cyclase n=1 Tax=Alginatibacterium sediminis TaxID=2164068 RepID=A0A420EDG9_9ALTE|nr:diguanylate cyclase [Alginatibacterium sediminis]RKF18718.1 sensor domain-containing diguanylate cyclase [Alginatibacterium sediminis]